jgi:tetratricopeptide (TPR) repeat protein
MTVRAFLIGCGVLAGSLAVRSSLHAQPLPSVSTWGNATNAGTPTSGTQSGMASLSPQSSVFIHGRVVMDDGSDLPLNVVIEKLCDSRPVALGYADRKGNFNVTLAADNTSGSGDASYDSNPQGSGASSVLVPLNASPLTKSHQALGSCDIRAAYQGLHSGSVRLTNPRSLDNPDVGTLVLHHATGAAGNIVSATTLNAPKNALKAFEQGSEALLKGKIDAAERDFRKAVELHPTFATAWYQLGTIELTKDVAAARVDFQKSLDADPKYILPYLQLSLMAASHNRWEEALDISTRGLHLDGSSFPQLYFYNAYAQYSLKNFDEAEKKDREAIRLDTDHRMPKTIRLLAYILVNKGDVPGAAEQMRAYLATGPDASEVEGLKRDLSTLEAHMTAQR